MLPSKFALLTGVAPAEEQDLTRVRYQSLESTIIVDNSPMAYMFQPENAIDCIRCGGCCVPFLARPSVSPRVCFHHCCVLYERIAVCAFHIRVALQCFRARCYNRFGTEPSVPVQWVSVCKNIFLAAA